MSMSNPDSGKEDDEGSIFADINVTPLVDIMLVLLIIFMVSTTVMTDAPTSSGIQVDLPKSSAKGGSLEDADIIIALTKDGQTVVGGETVDEPRLRSLLEDAKKKNEKTVVIVQADKEVFHGRVAGVLDLARAVGLQRLAIATESSE